MAEENPEKPTSENPDNLDSFFDDNEARLLEELKMIAPDAGLRLDVDADVIRAGFHDEFSKFRDGNRFRKGFGKAGLT